MPYLNTAVFGTSRKQREKRLPIHPGQIEWIDEAVRKHLFFEEGYGRNFGVSDDEIVALSGGVYSKDQLYQEFDVAILAKPTVDDLQHMRKGMIHWGWPHCVQQYDITQAAIDNQLTLIAWEAMHKWSKHGDWQMHIFHLNNEIAGYAGVIHAMNEMGIDGNYGPNRKAAIISFGSVSRGAIRALQSRGIIDINVLTQRHYIFIADQMAGINYYHFDQKEDGQLISLHPDRDSMPLIEELVDCDIIVNGILQNTDNPLMFVHEQEVSRLKRDCLIVDISCDEGMGFSFAKPTTFQEPIFSVDHVYYYGVDHTPSYLWNAATWEISKSLIPYLPIVMGGPEKWAENETIRRAIEIRQGEIVNPKIRTFQNR